MSNLKFWFELCFPALLFIAMFFLPLAANEEIHKYLMLLDDRIKELDITAFFVLLALVAYFWDKNKSVEAESYIVVFCIMFMYMFMGWFICSIFYDDIDGEMGLWSRYVFAAGCVFVFSSFYFFVSCIMFVAQMNIERLSGAIRDYADRLR